MPFPNHILDAIDRYVDGSMSPGETAAFEARLADDPALAAAVERTLAEQKRLRVALKRVMTTLAPSGLRERVVAALHDESSHGASDGAASGDGPLYTFGATQRWFDGPRRANAFAVAASLALVAGAIAFGVFGPRISDRPARGSADTPVSEVAERMTAAYERCAAHGSCGAQAQPWKSAEEAQASLAALLGRPMIIPDLQSLGFNFCSGGPFCVPGACDRGGQLLYCRLDERGDQCAWMSVLVAPVETPYLAFDPFGRSGPLQCGVDYTLATASGGAMHYWCDGVSTWFVKTDVDVEFDSLRELFPAG